VKQISLTAIPDIPEIYEGDNLASILISAFDKSNISLQEGDILTVTSKIVSKAEGRWVDLTTIQPGDRAYQYAQITGKDPREVALVLRESRYISRAQTGVLIVENHLGIICANAGIDHSNTRADGEWRLLLPEYPDDSARKLGMMLEEHFNVSIGVIVTDSQGRPFRLGSVGVAIGVSGMPALSDLRGQLDRSGKALQVTEVGFADEIAAAAGLVSGQSAEGLPVVLVRGLSFAPDDSTSASDLVRPPDRDLYR